MYRKLMFLPAIVFLSLLSLKASAIEDARLLRFPDIRKDLVAFVYAGDIWSVNAQGGDARRAWRSPRTRRVLFLLALGGAGREPAAQL